MPENISRSEMAGPTVENLAEMLHGLRICVAATHYADGKVSIKYPLRP